MYKGVFFFCPAIGCHTLSAVLSPFGQHQGKKGIADNLFYSAKLPASVTNILP
jgi:hypothetical protein